jgi:hypothetical protein
MSHYIIVEPHSDDAFLSLHQHIVDWVKDGHRVTIATANQYHYKHPATADRRLKEAFEYADAVGAEWMTFSTRRELQLGGRIILPIAIYHPQHIECREQNEQERVWYYVDQPYAITQRLAPALTALLSGMGVVSYKRANGRKWKHIEHFKTQSKFFHFNPVEKLKQTFEMIVKG